MPFISARIKRIFKEQFQFLVSPHRMTLRPIRWGTFLEAAKISFSDGHIDSIGQAIVSLSLVLFLVVLLTWPLSIKHKSSASFGEGGCNSQSCALTK